MTAAAINAVLDAITDFVPSLLKALVLLAICQILMKLLLTASAKLLDKSKLRRGFQLDAEQRTSHIRGCV